MKDIKIIKNEEIDKQKWDSIVNNSIYGTIYGSTFFLDIFAPKWKGLILGDYQIILPLIEKNYLVYKNLYNPLFIQRLGIYSSNLVSKKNLEKIEIFFKNSYSKINFKSNYDIFNHKIILNNHELDLSPSYEILFSNFSKNTKRNLKKALKNELTVTQVPFKEFINFKVDNSKFQFKKGHLKKWQLLLESSRKKINLSLFSVKDQSGNLLSIASFILWKNRWYYFLGATNEKGKKLSANFLIFNHFINSQAETSCILDFEGSNIPGVARYFEGWGAIGKPYFLVKSKR